MSPKSTKEYGPSTRTLRVGAVADPATGANQTPIYLSSAFASDSLARWRDVALGHEKADLYSRNSNPTVRAFEERMAELEGGERAVAFSTGMAAIAGVLFALLTPGKRAVTVRDAYGATYLLFSQELPAFGVDCAVVDTEDWEAVEAELAKGADLLYLETPTNPALKVLDIERLCAAARKAGALVVVDNTFATPMNQRPLSLGADVVLHSATKYICGHGDVMGGVVIGSDPAMERIFRWRELTGASMDPMSAFLHLRSLKTLGLRMARHNENGLAMARFLEGSDKIARVRYPGLASHPGHEAAARQMSGFGGVVSFDMAGGIDAATRFLEALELAWLAPNLGQIETVAGTAALTSHLELSAEEIEATGVPGSMIRLSLGIEDFRDLRADVEQALDKV